MRSTSLWDEPQLERLTPPPDDFTGLSTEGVDRGPYGVTQTPPTLCHARACPEHPERNRLRRRCTGGSMDFRRAGLAERWVLGTSPRMTSFVAAVALFSMARPHQAARSRRWRRSWHCLLCVMLGFVPSTQGATDSDVGAWAPSAASRPTPRPISARGRASTASASP
jgi:hypothetical protein